MYRVYVAKKTEINLKKALKEKRKRILASLLYLSGEPFAGDPLKGKFFGFYFLQIYPYSVIYSINGKQVLVEAVRRLGGVYANK